MGSSYTAKVPRNRVRVWLEEEAFGDVRSAQARGPGHGDCLER
jgi:hypothetical protein